MAVRVASFAFDGIEARVVDGQVQLSGAGTQVFNIVGLPDKAVRESQERVRAAFAALGLDLHMGRTAVELAPADLSKEGSHFDLPVAMGVLAALGPFCATRSTAAPRWRNSLLDGQIAPISAQRGGPHHLGPVFGAGVFTA